MLTGNRFDLEPTINWLVEYVTRIQSWLRKEVYQYYISRIQLQTPCTVFHVRRSDIQGHGLRKYHKIDEYIQALETKGKLHKNILLLTDDQNAIDEAESVFPNYNWAYFNRTRFRGNEGGWENHIPSRDPKLEVLVILSTFRAVRECDSIAMTHGNFAKNLVMEMRIMRGEGNITIANLGY
jgi:hypothetical protein